MREIVLDTETTGLSPDNGDRIVEIGCVELINHVPTNNTYQVYLNPEKDMDPGAEKVHGLTNEFLTNNPKFIEIVDDFLSENPMNRMIQGDVGCGKTIVSVLASAIVVDNHYQVAIMAPTDLLSKQLFRNFKSHFEHANIKCSLLVGSLKVNEKKEVLQQIKKGESKIVIGTHALFQKDVVFKNLGFVVIDEQHRFGVNQREKLLAKSKNPNLMAMTATPIPRTLAITYNGDMDLSIIDELPKNRPEIHTSYIEKDNLSTAYNFIREKVDDGGQTIIVYPLINESENQDLSAAVESYEYLRDNIFPDLEVGLMHGKLDNEIKNNEMKKFMDGEINILVSTTVVEVGIDNPNVNVILINNTERFGLSQIHQLRGRVGRGALTSYCLLCSDSESPKTKERLRIRQKGRWLSKQLKTSKTLVFTFPRYS